MKILLAVGTRPNFVKIAPIIRAIEKTDMEYILVHTGQHYDPAMSRSFFEELDIPEPYVNLRQSLDTPIGFGTMMHIFDLTLDKIKPDYVIVVGDVDSTFACALVAARRGIKVAHVEAGLRSFDRTMKEEINRILTDSISDLFFTTEEMANYNLLREGKDINRIFFVGNVMIDSLKYILEKTIDEPFKPLSFDVKEKKYGIVTLHRPSNVDNKEILESLLDTLYTISKNLRLIFPLHPRVKKNIALFGLKDKMESLLDNIIIADPLGYSEMIRLMKGARLVITDSGGVQEETTYLNVPCLTVRENTERPITVDVGTNILVGRDMKLLEDTARKIIFGEVKEGCIPPLWDGHAAERIVTILGKEGSHACE